MMNPISETAYYCSGIRMLDAESGNPICGDNFAKAFMDDHGKKVLDRFIGHEQHNIANLVRHKIIDDLVKMQLSKNPETTFIIIGAGFDTRAFRFEGGIWVEIDEPEIIQNKDIKLPVNDCKNQLIRIKHNFSNGRLDKILDQCKPSNQLVVIIEGVLRYLDKKEINDLINQLKNSFQRHVMVCDLMDKSFYEKYAQSTRKLLDGMNAIHKFNENNPEKLFQDMDYSLVDKISIINYCLENSMCIQNDKPVIEDNVLLNGYSVYVFEYQ